ncbi:low affinity immunoglobulin gamma Fc region receptor II-a isoform X2 [Larimichthys crocea]|uniref:low affinity immunoglobulin gamma Fc region receptor II-a isoform X2 n=1 Tax=Larimichthys crocea TaxID=215358 RepID=UPI000F5D82B0|nr:low affinity immunoglobulin gamma Fc region receptor II-a-like isoform X2 [Larimichthys crocea]
MEVTDLCIGLFVKVLVLLVAEDQYGYCAERIDGALLRVVPNRLQFFEFDSISFDCDGFDDFTEWRVMKRIMGVTSRCGRGWKTSRTPCSLEHVLEGDSGVYWCEANETAISNSVHITVTDGSVILESPAVPVLEGSDVTLHCRNKKTSTVHVADFYKDGTLKWTIFEGSISIHNVSKSDEGLYKCDIAGVESAESWLAVREGQPSQHHSSELIIVWTTATCSMTLLLLLVGLCLCVKHRVFFCISSRTTVPDSHSSETRTVSGLTAVVNPQRPIYSCVTANTSQTEPGVSVLTPTPTVDASSRRASDVYYTFD